MPVSRVAACGLGLHLACLASVPISESALPAPVQAPEARPPAPSSEPVASNVHELKLGAARLRVAFEGPAFDLGSAALLRWVERSAQAVEAYYGAFPVRSEERRVGKECRSRWSARHYQIIHITSRPHKSMPD